MAFINDNTSERRDFGGHHIKQDNRPAIEQVTLNNHQQ